MEPLPARHRAVLAELGFAVLSRESRAEPLRVPGLAEPPGTVGWVAATSPSDLATGSAGRSAAGRWSG